MTSPALSYVTGQSTQALIGETIGLNFDRTVAQWGDRPGLIVRQQGIRWSYAELGAKVDAFAAGLLALGLQPGERVGIWSPNNAEWVITQFATAKAGLVLVNINPAYRLSELEYALNKVGCRALIIATRFKTSDYVSMVNTLAPELARALPGRLTAEKLPKLEIVVEINTSPSPGMIPFHSILEMGATAHHERLHELADKLQFDDPINIQFTSGTTGAPKGATLTHHNILNNGFFIGEAMNLTPQDKLCIPVPLYHCFGMVLGNLACTTHGTAMVYPGEGFDPLATLQTVAIAYGMTETSPVSFQTSVDDPLDRRVSTVGRVQPHLEVKIIDSEGRIVPRGVPGELCTRGYAVMLGYWEDAERTAQAIDAARWMHTGDLATIDDEGFCNIVGRIKDMVIRGGENIYPREVEEFLYRHPKIEDVQVFGVPDQRFGEELCAWIKLRAHEHLTADDVRAFCAGQIAHYKVPRHIKFVESFPMTVTGKMQKFIMRDEMTRELGLQEAKTA